jgi:hypothetical protein
MAGRISYYGNIVKDGLVLDLDAAKRDSYPGTGTAWNDISGFRNNGVLTNGPTFLSASGGSIVFDGVNDYVLVPNISIGTKTFTIDIWFKMNGNQVDNAALFSVNAVASTSNLQISFFNSNQLFYFYNGGGTVLANAINFNTTFNTNTWYNIHITKDSNNNIKSYVNGIQTNSINYVANYNFTQQIRIGINRASDSYFKGNISITRLYVNKSLSATEVLQNYNATKGRYL